jgi:large subunit ribosomal protein L24
MQKIRKGDTVELIKGKDDGKRGRVIAVSAKAGRLIVEGANFAKKHKRQTRQDQQGGIVSIEMPLSVSNVMYFCKRCNKGVRLGFTVLKDGTKSRVCMSCKEAV